AVGVETPLVPPAPPEFLPEGGGRAAAGPATPSVRDRRRRSWALPVGGHGRHYHMAMSDTLSCHVLHCGLTRPEAQPTAHRNEWCTVLRSFQRHAPVVAAVRHPSLP